jgi:cytochrome c-type biogenesis protein CcmH/NrfG
MIHLEKGERKMILPIVLIIAVGTIVAIGAYTAPNMLVVVLSAFLGSRPNDSEGWCYYGQMLIKTGNELQAVEAFRKALAIQPDYTDCWKKLGDLLYRIGDIEGAEEAYKFL